MQESKHPQSSWRTNGFLFIIGIGTGWLVGLAVSPVVAIVITSLVGSAAAIVATLSGLDAKATEPGKSSVSNYRVDPLPLMLLVLGILCGSVAGIWVRNQNLLGSDVSSEAIKWERAGLMKSRTEIIDRLFELQYPISSSAGVQSVTPEMFKDSHSGTLLFAVSGEECTRLLSAVKLERAGGNASDLLNSISSFPSSISALPTIVTDTATIGRIIQQVICPEVKREPD